MVGSFSRCLSLWHGPFHLFSSTTRLSESVFTRSSSFSYRVRWAWCESNQVPFLALLCTSRARFSPVVPFVVFVVHVVAVCCGLDLARVSSARHRRFLLPHFVSLAGSDPLSITRVLSARHRPCVLVLPQLLGSLLVCVLVGVKKSCLFVQVVAQTLLLLYR